VSVSARDREREFFLVLPFITTILVYVRNGDGTVRSRSRAKNETFTVYMSTFLQQLTKVDCDTGHHALFINKIACVTVNSVNSFSFSDISNKYLTYSFLKYNFNVFIMP
jgi:hypothetical protein